MFNKVKIFVGILLIFLTAVLSTNLITQEAEAADMPIIIVSFLSGEETQSADVRPGIDSTVVFPCKIDIVIPDDSDAENISVTPSAFTDLDWNVKISPETIKMNRSLKDAFFNVTVSVPGETSSFVRDRLHLSAFGLTEPDEKTLNTLPVIGYIDIDQYYGLEVTVDEQKMSVTKGDSIVYEITITNVGNGEDTVIIRRPNQDYLDGKGLYVYTSSYSFSVGDRSRKVIYITVDSTNADAGKDYSIELVFESEGNAKENSTNTAIPVTLTCHVNPDNSVYYTIIVVIVVIILILAVFFKKTRKKEVYEDND